MLAPDCRVRWPLVLTVWLVGLLLTGATVGGALREVNDFTQDYLAALALRQGRSLYAPFTLAEVQAATRTSRWPVETMDYLPSNFHPPTCAVLFLPLTWLPYDAAFLVWSVLNVGMALFGTGLLLREYATAFPAPWPRLLLALPLFWMPFLDSFQEGQWSVFVMAALVSGWWLLRRGQPFAAGGVVAVAALVKVVPSIFILYFLVRRQYRAVAGFLVVLLAGSGVTTLTVGLSPAQEYLVHVGPECEAIFGPVAYNLSLHGLYRRLEADQWPWAVRRAGGLALAGLGVGLAWLLTRRYADTTAGADRGFALMILAMLLCAPITWPHALVVLLMPLAVLWSQHPIPRTGWWCGGMLGLYALPIGQVMRAALQGSNLKKPPLAESWPLLIFTAGMILLAGLVAAWPRDVAKS